jgi:hypothetical protein
VGDTQAPQAERSRFVWVTSSDFFGKQMRSFVARRLYEPDGLQAPGTAVMGRRTPRRRWVDVRFVHWALVAATIVISRKRSLFHAGAS